MHEIMPHKYVFHLHCLNTLSLVIQSDFQKKIGLSFKDLNYGIVNYAMPGIPLTKEIKKLFNNFVPDILFLANHGLVVGANSVKEVLKIIYEISSKLEKPKLKPNLLNQTYLDTISESTLYRPIKYFSRNY